MPNIPSGAFGVGKDVAVPGPDAWLVGVDEDGVALTRADQDAFGVVGLGEWDPAFSAQYR